MTELMGRTDLKVVALQGVHFGPDLTGNCILGNMKTATTSISSMNKDQHQSQTVPGRGFALCLSAVK